jgi:hypothetical protein
MWWPILTGAMIGCALTWAWGRRGALCAFAAGPVVALGFDAFLTFVVAAPPSRGLLLQHPGFIIEWIMIGGVLWSSIWWLGACFGITAGFKIRQRRHRFAFHVPK